jgi:16S rRNA A1518/A1519 N6-dimethyltransferase RsmA/KsgA/DIM1 with predicted DNA glycosylase/AP lyase activity
VPPPKVESAVLRFIVKKDIDVTDTKWILSLVKMGFAERRKKLLSNLEKWLKIDKNSLREAFLSLGFSENIRAEELSVNDWKKLSVITKN